MFVQFFAIGPSATQTGRPQGDGIAGIGRNRRNPRREQSGKGKKGATTSQRIHPSGQKRANGHHQKCRERDVHHPLLGTLDFATRIQQISDGTVGNPGVVSQADFTGAIGGIALGAVVGEFALQVA